MVLGTLALATVGTVFSAISSQARMRELLLAAAAAAAADAGADRQHRSHRRAVRGSGRIFRRSGSALLAAFDVIFLTVTWLFGEYLLEE